MCAPAYEMLLAIAAAWGYIALPPVMPPALPQAPMSYGDDSWSVRTIDFVTFQGHARAWKEADDAKRVLAKLDRGRVSNPWCFALQKKKAVRGVMQLNSLPPCEMALCGICLDPAERDGWHELPPILLANYAVDWDQLRTAHPRWYLTLSYFHSAPS